MEFCADDPLEILPESGRLIGKGHLMVGDESRGVPVSCDIIAESDDHGLTFTGELETEGLGKVNVLVNFQPDNVGQYDVTAGYNGRAIEGKAKLAAWPGIVLVATGDKEVWGSFTLFEANGRFGLRGLLRDKDGDMSCEIAFQGELHALRSDNVVSLMPRRR